MLAAVEGMMTLEGMMVMAGMMAMEGMVTMGGMMMEAMTTKAHVARGLYVEANASNNVKHGEKRITTSYRDLLSL